jgi:hypothetical protein
MRIFGSDFEFFTISLLVMAKKHLFCKSYIALLYLLIIDFPKFDPLTATGMALCVSLGQKCQILFPLGFRLSRIEFSLV